MLRINIVTIFPGFFEGPLGLSIPKRARDAGVVDYRVVDLRGKARILEQQLEIALEGPGDGAETARLMAQVFDLEHFGFERRQHPSIFLRRAGSAIRARSLHW